MRIPVISGLIDRRILVNYKVDPDVLQKLLPQRFPTAVGMLTGIVGAAGGLGGFFLPSVLGVLKDKTGTFGTGFAVLTLLAASGATALALLGQHWRRTWPQEAAARAGIRPKAGDLAESYATTV
jgi:nitrate/nitrite transporter NarK